MPARGTASKSHGGSEWKLRGYRRSTSALHGALELQQSSSWNDDDVEQSKPKRRSRTEVIDGRKITFALMREVNQLPETSRKKRLESDWRNINVQKSSVHRRWEHELQQYLMLQSIPVLTVYYLVVFLFMNIFFASFWYMTEDKCCDDPSMTFAQIFDFAVQTSSTIGYGGYWPKGYFNNALVVLVTVLSICQATVYAGLLFFRFITPQCHVQFSEVITMSNVLGTPCFEIRIGNADGKANKLINVDASLCVTSVQNYIDPDDHSPRKVVQTEDLELAVSTQHKLNGVWTIRHFIDEKSPLHGLRFDEFPGKDIYSIQLNVKAIQKVTKGEVYSQTAYQVHDIMVGHRFEDMAIWDEETRKGYFDYAKLSSIQPSFVWYPVEGSGISESVRSSTINNSKSNSVNGSMRSDSMQSSTIIEHGVPDDEGISSTNLKFENGDVIEENPENNASATMRA
ncbi:unnamed protein product [Cylindrotheca closterium]|uniref:Inward rectifier potassium channel C-terminal domain-containing protein n=1 Tax=Cylindrotheca closterium TaxID=2856 RepID=A0AAD2FHP3_9STRA|nr:unnamed protein product [Cylindrotheca closterium]